jgi:Dolichyl-phosphate-mannose-protein mannosyltransferase
MTQPTWTRRDIAARKSPPAELIFCLIPVVVAAALIVWFRPLLTSGLWWDEQWRAYHVVLPGLDLDLKGTYAPTAPVWLLICKLPVALFGVREWALRTPSVVAWILLGPLTYLLCRRVMGRVASLVAGTALAATPAIVYFDTELKPYAMETLATVAIVLAWARAHESVQIHERAHAHQRVYKHDRFGNKRRLGWYGAIAVISLVSVPALFIVAPLMAFDAVKAVRKVRSKTRESVRELTAVGATSIAVVVPWAVTVLHQPASDEFSYFHFLPRDLPQAFVDAIRGIGAFFAAAWTSASMIKTDTRSVPLAAPSHPLFACAEWGVAVLVVIGAWHLRNNLVGQGLACALAGGLVLQAIASLLHAWPLGIARVNLFLLPVVYMLTVAGLAWAWQVIHDGQLISARAIAMPILVAGTLLLGAILVQDTVTTQALHRDLPMQRWAEDLNSVVARARDLAGPSALAVVQMDGAEAGFFAEPPGARRGLGWIFYMDYYKYSERLGARIPLSLTYFADIADTSEGALRIFIADHPRATMVAEYAALAENTRGPNGGSLIAECIRRSGFHPYLSYTYRDSGQLTMWRR